MLERWKRKFESCGRMFMDESGQSTVEYAILLGVLVVIAVGALSAFSGKLQSLWDGISQSINSL